MRAAGDRARYGRCLSEAEAERSGEVYAAALARSRAVPAEAAAGGRSFIWQSLLQASGLLALSDRQCCIQSKFRHMHEQPCESGCIYQGCAILFLYPKQQHLLLLPSAASCGCPDPPQKGSVAAQAAAAETQAHTCSLHAQLYCTAMRRHR